MHTALRRYAPETINDIAEIIVPMDIGIPDFLKPGIKRGLCFGRQFYLFAQYLAQVALV